MHYTIRTKIEEYVNINLKRPKFLFLGHIQKEWFIKYYGSTPIIIEALPVVWVDQIDFMYVG